MIYFLAVFAVTFGISVVMLLVIGNLYGTVRIETNPRLSVEHEMNQIRSGAGQGRLQVVQPVLDPGNLHPLPFQSAIHDGSFRDRAA